MPSDSDIFLDVPADVQAELRRAFGQSAPPSPSAAGAAMADFKKHQQSRRRARVVHALLGVAAVAVTVLLAIWLRPAAAPSPPPVIVEDVDGNGSVDILDAFALARQLPQGAVDRRLDLNADGLVDQRDVDALVARAVQISPAVTTATATQPAKFVWVDVLIDVQKQSLAAYQVEIVADAGQFAGLQGGDHEAFANAPYFDPAALQQTSVTLAAYSTAKELPTGRTQIARLQFRTGQTPKFTARLITAAAADGQAMSALVSVEPADTP